MSRQRRYSTHMPSLIAAVDATFGDVLELGSGPSSTPLLHWMTTPRNRRLLTLEGSDKWFQFASQFSGRLHQVELVKDWDAHTFDQKWWDVVLVDHEAHRRATDIIRLARKAKFIVIHDTCGRDERHYGYKAVYPHFKYIWGFHSERPRTAVVSNFSNPADFGFPR